MILFLLLAKEGQKEGGDSGAGSSLLGRLAPSHLSPHSWLPQVSLPQAPQTLCTTRIMAPVSCSKGCFFFALLFASWTNANPRQEQSRAEPHAHTLPTASWPSNVLFVSGLGSTPLPTRGYKGMEEAQQAISSQQKIFPHVAFLQCFEGRFSLESSMCQQHGLPCTSLHGKSLPYKGTSLDWRSLLLCFLCSPPALLVWLALNEKSYESNNVNFTLSHQKLYPSYFLEK